MQNIRNIYATYTPDIRQIYAKYTPDIRQIYAKYTPDIRHIYARYTPDIRKYTPDIRKIYARYATNIRQIYARYTPNIRQIYARHTANIRLRKRFECGRKRGATKTKSEALATQRAARDAGSASGPVHRQQIPSIEINTAYRTVLFTFDLEFATGTKGQALTRPLLGPH